MSEIWLECINCKERYELINIYNCKECGDLLDIKRDLGKLSNVVSKKLFDSRLELRKFPYVSGVWRFKELIYPLINDRDIISRPEGNTNLYKHDKLSKYVGITNLLVKHEGENPTGSFKDRGMTVGISEAKRQGVRIVACASTGNTSASMASYASLAELKSIVFIPEGGIAYGKLSQALAYGAKVLQVKGNFDTAMKLVQKSSKELGMYILNSINPWRLEGQKSIIFELIQQLGWQTPDWVIVPAGNLGNTSAFGKAFAELKELNLIEKIPRIASIQAEKANPFYKTWKSKSKLIKVENPKTIATAIRIGNPVNWKKALNAIKLSNGIVEQVSDEEIMDAKAIVDSCGIGCEPSSAASVAGAKKLREKGIIDKDEKIVCILTGNILKDPDATINYHLNKLDIEANYANRPISIEADLKSVKSALSIK